MILKVTKEYEEKKQPTKENLEKAAKAIKDGKLVIFPTETVYGIGANALEKTAAQKIFEAKGRASDNPLIVHISDFDMLEEVAKINDHIEKKLMEHFWPGPLTIILEKKNIIPAEVSANLETVGIRMPSHPVAQKLIKLSGVPIAAPSANLSGRPSGTIVQDIKDEFAGKVDIILDGGMVDIGLESTVIRIIDNKVHILRPGKITAEQISQLGFEVVIDSHVLQEYNGKEAVTSPGMKYRHYAPKTKCSMVYSKQEEKMIETINKISENGNILVLGRTRHIDKYKAKYVLDMGDSLEEIAHNIFSMLRKVDKYDVEQVLIEGIEKDGLGLAIYNRLIRACEYQVIEC